MWTKRDICALITWMVKTNDFLHRIKRKWMKMRLQPIQVYCQHHVCAEFDAESMNACDWMLIDAFKEKVLAMRQSGIQFISLTDAYRHICKDWIRYKKYAVLTFDDGYSSLKEILPWLNEQHIPATLFINGKYLDGKSYRNNPKESYLTKEELWTMTSPLIEIGSHGWEHVCATRLTEEEFEYSVERNVSALLVHPNYIPFWAYTYGAHTEQTDVYLQGKQIVPVYVDKKKNYNDSTVIHRELLTDI